MSSLIIPHLGESPLRDRVGQLGEDELQHLQGDVREIQEDSSVILLLDRVILIPDSVICELHH